MNYIKRELVVEVELKKGQKKTQWTIKRSSVQLYSFGEMGETICGVSGMRARSPYQNRRRLEGASDRLVVGLVLGSGLVNSDDQDFNSH